MAMRNFRDSVLNMKTKRSLTEKQLAGLALGRIKGRSRPGGKGKNPWNKGLKSSTDSRVAAYSAKRIKGKVKNCLFCKKEFYKSPALNQRFCNKTCYSKYQSLTRTGENANGYKRGFSFHGKGRRAYITRSVHGKKRFDHRLIMEKYLGRKLEYEEVVHHINDDPMDNRIENLILTTRQEHMKLHVAMRKKKVEMELPY